MGQVRRITFRTSGDPSGDNYFVFPRGANTGQIYETLDANGYEPHGRHNTTCYDCSGMVCCTKIHIYNTKKHRIAHQRFYRDI